MRTPGEGRAGGCHVRSCADDLSAANTGNSGAGRDCSARAVSAFVARADRRSRPGADDPGGGECPDGQSADRGRRREAHLGPTRCALRRGVRRCARVCAGRDEVAFGPPSRGKLPSGGSAAGRAEADVDGDLRRPGPHPSRGGRSHPGWPRRWRGGCAGARRCGHAQPRRHRRGGADHPRVRWRHGTRDIVGATQGGGDPRRGGRLPGRGERSAVEHPRVRPSHFSQRKRCARGDAGLDCRARRRIDRYRRDRPADGRHRADGVPDPV